MTPDSYRDWLFDYLIIPRKRLILKNKMGLHNELPVYKASYDLLIGIFQFTKDFPKEYKYTLGQDMKRDGIQLVRSIYRANKSKDKREYLEQFLDDFEVLKLEIRLCVDMKILSIKKQAELSQMMKHRQTDNRLA